MDYLAFLTFIAATGLYWFMGSGGPLHKMDIQSRFQAQVDADTSSNTVLLWLVGAPTAAFAVSLAILEGLFGGVATLFVGAAALFFSFGREDYPTITQRFLARARAGDNEGAAMVVESAGGNAEAEDEDGFTDVASVFFSKMALQRWFGPVIYFFLLGPSGAVAYRLAHATQETATPIGESVMRIIEWLPSRLMVLSFAVFGDFDKTLGHITEKGISLEPSTDEFFEDAADAALGDANTSSVYERLTGLFRLLDRSFLLWLGVLALLVLV